MRALLLSLGALLLGAGCIGPEDNPSSVHDLRVLGVSLEPPELMMRPAQCLAPEPADLLTFLQEVEYRALIVDPSGAGRVLDYQLWACADVADRDCDVAEERVLLAEGTTPEGELVLHVRPATAQLPDGTPLVQVAATHAQYGGAFGLWLPLVLHLKAGEEEIRAQKLMVLSCAFFPQMQPNQTPRLQGILINDAPLPEAAPVELSGPGPFALLPVDFSALEEPYVLPTLSDPPEPVDLIETWKVSWYTDQGGMSPNQTGGTDPGGGVARHNAEWHPPPTTEPLDVRFWFVVRDGRGGLSWITRSARYVP